MSEFISIFKSFYYKSSCFPPIKLSDPIDQETVAAAKKSLTFSKWKIALNFTTIFPLVNAIRSTVRVLQLDSLREEIQKKQADYQLVVSRIKI